MSMLIEHNQLFLNQGIEFIGGLSDEHFVKPSIGSIGGGIGPHFRHCIEHYESLVNGLPSGKIDYDLRKRDLDIERNRHVAIAKMEALRDLLPELGTDLHKPLLVKMETHGSEDHEAVWVDSSFGRELMAVINHTVHHYALIGFLARYHGSVVSKDFGVAPSTLKYLATKA